MAIHFAPRSALRGLALALFATTTIGGTCAQEQIELETINVEGAAANGETGSATSPTTGQAKEVVRRVPGAVEVVPDTQWRNTPAKNIKDILDYTPGVFVQPKWGDDSRLSIRGSGLSRSFHLRGVQLYMDGIPISTADGGGDFQEIDPSAYRYTEVFKGTNALRYGANALGGAINFVTPTGRDADRIQSAFDIGSFGFKRAQASSGGEFGNADYFITGSWQESDGFRDHSWGDAMRGSANIGYQIAPNIETRFYLNANNVEQRIPGTVLKSVALTRPETAAPGNVAQHYQRNIETVRIANKTAIMLDHTVVEFGVFGVDRKLDHPIFQWLDYDYVDAGGFARAVDERDLGGRNNRFMAGFNLHWGEIDNTQYDNNAGEKGDLRSSSLDESLNVAAYAENTHYILPEVGIVAALQYMHAERTRTDRFLDNGDQSGGSEYDELNPKLGVLWDVDPTWQVFANVSRSSEAPTFSENPVTANVEAQTAWTFEAGTRGDRDTYAWDIAIYRMQIESELQCQYANSGGSTCTVINLNDTIHQGIEAGFGFALFDSLFDEGDRLWLHGAYTFNDFRFDDDPDFGDNELPGAPRHFVRAELMYKHASGFAIGPNVEWVPESYYVDNANTLKTEGYALLGARAVYDNGGPFSAYLEGRNLTGEKYIASVSTISNAGGIDRAVFEPGTGRGVYGGVKFRW